MAFTESSTPTLNGLEGPASPLPSTSPRESATTARVFVPPPSTPRTYGGGTCVALLLDWNFTGRCLAFIGEPRTPRVRRRKNFPDCSQSVLIIKTKRFYFNDNRS